MGTKDEPKLNLRRRKPAVIKAVEDLDAFPKVPETCVQTTSYGGTASIIAVIFIIWLSILELSYFLDTNYTFKFTTDTNLDAKLSINVDLTVGMPCGMIGADIVDSTNQNVMKFGELEEENVHFALSESQRAYFNAKASLNIYLREQYHSLINLLWKSDFINMYSEMPKMSRDERFDRGLPDACRLHGKLEINKVAGNFHVTAGKTLPFPTGHAHIAAFMSERNYNFSHRIYKFSFGDGMPAIVHSLEGDEKVATSHHMLYQYFIQVVPTIVRTRFRTYHTYQYSVRELAREINHEKGSHGVSGIFFKYDMSGFQVEVTEQDYPLWKFLVRLCAVIGGVYATVGMVYSNISNLSCSFKLDWVSTNTEKTYNSLNHNVQKSGNPLLGNSSEPIITTPIITTPLSSPGEKEANINNTSNGALPDLLSSHSQVFTSHGSS